ncbi:MAG: hypothetical protein IPN67_12200 [Bacteroidales bacterium]|nr:hypothetical protein [Bacteroidales bacterium]
MKLLPVLILFLYFVFSGQKTESPHGSDFKVTCSTCHSSKGWEFDTSIYSFDHNRTKFALTGQHIQAGCRDCHISLVFSEAKTECNECHTDVHQSTAGLDCGRCHTPASWLVNNIMEIHQTSRFPLLGAHRTADCSDCHKSETSVRFDVPGVNCIDCHRENYTSATNPNHSVAGFSEDCSSCHPVNSFTWTGAGFNHSFFPLAQGHSGLNCTECHKTASYADANPDCLTCHQSDYDNTTNPNHQSMGFPTTCSICHTLSPGWKPAAFKDHDNESFPIYSGRHNGTWNSCADCHTNPASYAQFTCLSCHEHNKTSMDNQHDEVGGYSYNSTECLRCHPRGNEE